MRPLLLAALLALPQDPAAKPGVAVDRIVLQDRSEVQGEIVECTVGGRLKVKLSGLERPVEVLLEDVARLRFTTDESRPKVPGPEQVRLVGGGSLGARVASFDGEIAVLDSAIGSLQVRRRDLKSILMSPPEGPLPELREDKRDILIREIEKKVEGVAKPVRECVADYGFLRSIGATVKFQAVIPAEAGGQDKVEEREYERGVVRHIYLYRDAPNRDLPAGLFAKIAFANGDRWVALLQGMDRENIQVFSHLFGAVVLPKSKIHTVSFTQQARLTGGNLLVADSTGIHEFDARGKEVWIYNQGGQGASIA
ncbi:MAG TPA: hypothetical protein VE981_21185, partial [Planctomycetota bacterium]|nr:hypothetical protein [Planctomycetota bacterium]